MKRKSYSELSKLSSFKERFEYLKCDSKRFASTFANERYLNQSVYSGRRWKETRDKVIIRDLGCDLGVPGYEINQTYASTEGLKKRRKYSSAEIHHINPLTPEQIATNDPAIYDMDNLILCSYRTHDAIHYGGSCPHLAEPIERSPNDTSPWRRCQ